MARPREFDEAETVARARDLFWSRGYGGTSIADLVDTLRVQRGSLYGAFGDKRGLYLQAVRLYAAENRARLEALVAAEPLLPALRAMLGDPAQLAHGARRPGPRTRGCFLGNTTVELVPADTEARAIVDAAFDGFVDVVAAALAHGQQRGEIAKTASPEAQAQLLLVLFQGSSLIARADDGSRARTAAGIEVALGALTADARRPERRPPRRRPRPASDG